MKVTSRGLTLIELLVVVSIIGLLSSVVLASMSTARTAALDASRISNLREVEKALQMYMLEHNGQYPDTTSRFGEVGRSSCTSGWYASVARDDVIPGLVPKYIAKLPDLDP